MKTLPNVTLVCVATVEVDASVKALEYSQKDIEFGDVPLVAKKSYPSNKPYRFIHIDPFSSVGDWDEYVVFELAEHILTDFALLVHSDGFVVNPHSWHDQWLEYDYIGSPFPLPKDDFSYRDVNGDIVRVGNSVSLRSKKLLHAPRDIGLRWADFDGGFPHEDGYLCVQHRHTLQDHGMRFAPLDIAARFGREVNLPEHKGVAPFVFHKWDGPNRHYPCFNPAAVRKRKLKRIQRKLKALTGL